MFQLLQGTKIDFMSRRKAYLMFSGIVVVACIAVLGVKWLNLGIEFTGGTEMQIKYVSEPDLGKIRSAIDDAGIGNAVVTTIGDESMHEVYIRLGVQSDELEGEELTESVKVVLHSPEERELAGQGQININEADEHRLGELLKGSGALSDEEADALAAAIAAKRREVAIFASFDDLEGIPGMTPEARSVLENGSFVGEFALRSQSYIGPAVGHELLNKAMLAVVLSLCGVLVYIGIRFQFRWGAAALVALAHDTVITIGLFSLFNQEMTLPVVAAFLTLIGYSVNDTVVVFDRIRENIKIRGQQDMIEIVNRSINQTLSRTVITSGSTWFVVLGIYLLGGEALRSFAFVLMVGVLVGTYSSICIASPVLVMWREAKLRRKGIPSKPSANGRGSAKKAGA